MSTIIVGVDGSAESKAALRWAVEEASLRSAKVKAVYAYDYEPSWRLYEYAAAGPLSDVPLQAVQRQWEREGSEAEHFAMGLVQGAIRDADTTSAGVEVEPVVIRDRRPARTLTRLSRSADLLVVGSRGRGGFSGLLLGSCSQQCAQFAACPIVIVRSKH